MKKRGLSYKAIGNARAVASSHHHRHRHHRHRHRQVAMAVGAAIEEVAQWIPPPLQSERGRRRSSSTIRAMH